MNGTPKVYADFFLVAWDASGKLFGCAPELGERAASFKSIHERAGRTVTRHDVHELAELLKSRTSNRVDDQVVAEVFAELEVLHGNTEGPLQAREQGNLFDFPAEGAS
ncbi:hypothetical protein [Deinococcus yavapaiensis]|uniref:Uncharacterized protein n=1 Tax=Deinococcus yavapaiensis KR-236 TaxID=694435 RepID=A0A318S3L0_9DEIO|nr:hypothetical protein [Deinococcus yavapaiensis]PYE51037.1 hypothetical protein DES52_116104 [Deinococcus yavapaiensis KR-236]